MNGSVVGLVSFLFEFLALLALLINDLDFLSPDI